ncbi:hypothetical protein [Fulvivirga sedimenti]|uniref:Glycosyltransferase family 2 protein n=1 Tax=Fulvivirga sedimenti TaxID=2879465 RepID=A0A9X1HQ72_9BACT|nr:hypothetical protein [Fulvivirga sedimenti]MCA6074774.1 hypothetical protein [Fulvivirga sedimenti]MCA6075951.1 hypothetical protein [Fulvivirga sedimenti]MCA6077079.1 hypothetical protein [Fulvivirga sedimenti]
MTGSSTRKRKIPGRSHGLHPDLKIYFERYAAGPALLPPPETPPELIFTIPAHREENIAHTIDSLLDCEFNRPSEILVLLNYSENSPQAIRDAHHRDLEHLRNRYEEKHMDNVALHFLLRELPHKHAGVGLARKILMDEAARRLDPDTGVIIGLDADCLVSPNYVSEIEKHFLLHPEIHGASIWFEHAIPESGLQRDAIIAYELHLRYFIEAQRMLKLPYAYHTVGSSMAVRPMAYAKAGGMNRRKAGEDFYFLHKIIPRGFGEINTTAVYPSARSSDRVPFGTGRAVQDLIASKRDPATYAPENIMIIKNMLNNIYNKVLNINKLNSINKQLLEYMNAEENFQRIRRNSSDLTAYHKHFYAWFDGFQLMKALHFLRDNLTPDVPVDDAGTWLLKVYHNIDFDGSSLDLLLKYRQIQRI